MGILFQVYSCASKDALQQESLEITAKEFHDAKCIVFDYNKSIMQENIMDDMPLIKEYILNVYEKVDNYTQEELNDDYTQSIKTLKKALELGFNLKDKDGNEIITMESTLGIDEKDLNEPNRKNRLLLNLEKQAQKSNITIREYINKYVLVVYKVEFAKEYLKSYFYKNVYDGDWIRTENYEKQLNEEYQQGYIEFEKQFNEYLNSLPK